MYFGAHEVTGSLGVVARSASSRGAGNLGSGVDAIGFGATLEVIGFVTRVGTLVPDRVPVALEATGRFTLGASNTPANCGFG